MTILPQLSCWPTINKKRRISAGAATTSALEALNYLAENKPDLVFLDVQMPELNGMDIINLIKNTGTKVILTTAYTNYAIDGYEHDIVDYLLKPITLQRFMLSINKAKARINSEKAGLNADFVASPHYIFVKTEYRSQKIDLAAISYIEGLGDYVTVHTSTGKILSLDRMKNMEQLLPSDSFIRIHKSFIVNINHIDFIEKGVSSSTKNICPLAKRIKKK